MKDSLYKLWIRGGWSEDIALKHSNPPFGPRNTWSNVAYAIVGCYIAWLDQSSQAAALAVALCLLATGSGLYHSQKTVWANRLDWLGMYAVTGALLPHGFWPHSAITPWLMLVIAGTFGAIYALKLLWISRDIHILILMLLSSAPVVFRGTHPQHVLLALGWLVFGIGYVAWHLDKRHSKIVGLWGHAIWHVTTAISIGLLYQAQK